VQNKILKEEDMSRYIVIGPGRSGTTVTHLLLRGHPDVAAVSDELRAKAIFDEGLNYFASGKLHGDELVEGRRGIMDLFFNLCGGDQAVCSGVKFAVVTAHEAEVIVNYLQSELKDVKVIITSRDDVLAQYASLVKARKTGHWHSWTANAEKAATTVRLNRYEYSSYYKDNQRILESLRSLKETHDCIEINFEADLMSGTAYQAKLFKFLGLRELEPDWLKSKKVSPPAEEYVQNYQQIKNLEPLIAERDEGLLPGALSRGFHQLCRKVRRAASAFLHA
jgi:hypothetical protein